MDRLAAYIHDSLFPTNPSPAGALRLLLTGLALGIALRLGMQWFADFSTIAGDAVDYLGCARNILRHHTFSSDLSAAPVPGYYRPPMYSAFLAAVIALFGERVFAVQLVQIALSLLTGLMVTRIAARLAPPAAPFVFVMMMLSPFEAVYTGVLLSESLTAFLLAAAVCAAVTLEGRKRWGVGGILFGLVVLTRDVYWPLLLMLSPVWLLFGAGRFRSRVADLAVLGLCFAMVVAPWTMRNYRVTQRLIPVSEGRLGLSLWFGTWTKNGEFTKAYTTTPVYPPEAYRNEREKELVQRAQALGAEGDAIFKSLAVARIKDEPLAVLGRYLLREPLLWTGTRFDIFTLNQHLFPRGSLAWKGAKIMLWGLNFALLLLGLAGMALALRRRLAVSLLALPIVFTALIYLPFNSFEARYSQPVYPFLLVFSAMAACCVVERFFLRERKCSAAAA